jgi:hypothetical protein
MLHAVIQVIPTQDYKVYVYFSDGKIKLFDMNHLIGIGIFAQISDYKVFMEKCTVLNDTLAWDVGNNFDETSCIDIDPESIYEAGIEVSDPLSNQVA